MVDLLEGTVKPCAATIGEKERGSEDPPITFASAEARASAVMAGGHAVGVDGVDSVLLSLILLFSVSSSSERSSPILRAHFFLHGPRCIRFLVTNGVVNHSNSNKCY